MALLLVPHGLSCRGLPCHVLAYYPWRFKGDSSCSYSQTVGVDSCGIFYVKERDIESRLNWPFSHIERLLSAGKFCGVVTSDWDDELHTYEQLNRAPGMPWWCYRCSGKKTEAQCDRHLETMLQEFLRCRMPQEEWAKVRKDKNAKVEWTRFRQKQMPKEGLFVDGEFHSGAHMNLVVFTVNAKPLMSDEAEAKAKKKKAKNTGRPVERGHNRDRNPDRGGTKSIGRTVISGAVINGAVINGTKIRDAIIMQSSIGESVAAITGQL